MLKEIMRKRMNKKGFTLTELIIVIAIIAILAAILIPLFLNFRADAEFRAGKALARNLGAVYTTIVARGEVPTVTNVVAEFRPGATATSLADGVATTLAVDATAGTITLGYGTNAAGTGSMYTLTYTYNTGLVTPDKRP